MPHYDLYHEIVKQALVKDGWTITHDPFTLELADLKVFADLGADKPIAAARGERKIVVEIKTFAGPSPVSELEKAIGQYNIYRAIMRKAYADRELFLAVALDIYQDFFQRRSIQMIVADQQMLLLVFEPDTAEVVQWIS